MTAQIENAEAHTKLNLSDEEFRDLVKQHHGMLLRIAQSFVDKETSKEVVQEAWASIYLNISKFEGRSSLKTWMCKITANEAISHLRKANKQPPIYSESGTDNEDESAFFERFDQQGHWKNPLKEWNESDPEKILASDELQECIEHILSTLPPKQRMAFYLSHFEGESSANICNLMDISASNMKVLIHRARMKLFDHITNFQETGKC